MRVIHVVPGISEEASGPSYSVLSLCDSLMKAGEDVTLATINWSPISSTPSFVEFFPLGVGPRRLGRSPQLSRWLAKEIRAKRVQVIHNHGMWQMSAIYPGKAAANSTAKLVVSPRGSFSSWAMNHGSWFKGPFWTLFQRAALAPTSCFHATADAEYADIRRLGFRQPVAIISNGVDVPERFHKEPAQLRTLLFLGRIHPKKGVDILLRAWAEVQDRFNNWRLLIVGTDKGYGGRAGYLDEMTQIAATLRLKRVEFSNPLYGEAKWMAYCNAELYVLPTHSENFGMTVAEALAAGTPVIVSKGAPWRDIESHRAGWWIDIGVEPLVAALEQAMTESFDALVQRGKCGREWMIRDFSWTTMGIRMHETYRWLMNGGKPPAWVKID